MKFIREYTNDDNTTEIWLYDTDITPNGPINVDIKYPKNYISPEDKLKKDERNLPMSKRTFLNQETGKFISYSRAKQLGII